MNSKVIFFSVLMLLGLITCTTDIKEDRLNSIETLDSSQYKTVNKGEYIQIIDDAQMPEKKTKRLINANAQLALGEIHIILGDHEWRYVAFKKGGTSMHMSDKGLRMNVVEHNGFQWWCVLDNKNIIADASGTYTPRELKGTRSAMQYFILVDDGEKQKWNWTKGTFYLEEFNEHNGEVSGRLIGSLTNERYNQVEKVEMHFKLRFEDITSTIGFTIG
jgi:hypothetical protein